MTANVGETQDGIESASPTLLLPTKVHLSTFSICLQRPTLKTVLSYMTGNFEGSRIPVMGKNLAHVDHFSIQANVTCEEMELCVVT